MVPTSKKNFSCLINDQATFFFLSNPQLFISFFFIVPNNFDFFRMVSNLKFYNFVGHNQRNVLLKILMRGFKVYEGVAGKHPFIDQIGRL